MTSDTVPVLITWDVDPSPWLTQDRRKSAVRMALDLCNEVGIQTTFLFVAKHASQYTEEIQQLRNADQEIGCHGLTHGDEEEYPHMPAAQQRTYIEEATGILESLVGTPIRTFRGPRVKISHHALKVLAECGYWSDCSVCSQRIDFISSNLINRNWVFAPRLPYRPSKTSAFKKGDLPIWEIPVSALIVPFISTSLNIFGLWFMKLFLATLYRESKRTGKPIVYLAHTSDFMFLFDDKSTGDRFSWSELSPEYIWTHGIAARRMLYRTKGTDLWKRTRALFTYALSLPGVEFMTVQEYVRNKLGIPVAQNYE